MAISWQEVILPDFGPPGEPPVIPAAVYAVRCDRAYAAAKADWLVVYGDREHFANLLYLIGYDPRFEEGILLLGAGGRRLLLVGNEGVDYATLLTVPLEVILCQSLSLPGQDRSRAPRLRDLLRDAGISQGQTIGLIGWKYLEPEEWTGRLPGFFAPAMLVDTLRDLAGDPVAVQDATPVLLHPHAGLRATNEAVQIAAFEWAAARVTAAMRRLQCGTQPGMTEYAAASTIAYEGDPTSTHLLFASGAGKIVGLRSPGPRQIAVGDSVASALGFWGGLCARAGLLSAENQQFLEQLAIPYFRGVVTWYETVRVGVTGGEVFERVTASLAAGGLQPALNPGHLTGHDEWVHSPVVAGGTLPLQSGMAFQCDIIPTPTPPGWLINCEDPVIFAAAPLRAALAAEFPGTWARIAARQQFMRKQLGLAISDDLLPLSSMPAYLAPLWLAPTRVLLQH